MRVIMTGSRTWKDERFVFQVMHLITGNHPGTEITWVHGDADGLDTIVRRIVEQSNQWRPGVFLPHAQWQHEPHPADWKMGRQAGTWRNTHMVNLRADLCGGFVMPCRDAKCRRRDVHGSHGTLDCLTKAEEAGIETWRFSRATA